ncbi:GNAT family N-acetyltransferase [Candidatus Uhrbacteria bacterium]|nr:GNAT family N-acetyltransferase [Candidatus Uhrbacteria bacterium]MBD3283971.1 GNAT family N-acetyltransferase [Candidatus Uhrbacteria bacterium]
MVPLHVLPKGHLMIRYTWHQDQNAFHRIGHEQQKQIRALLRQLSPGTCASLDTKTLEERLQQTMEHSKLLVAHYADDAARVRIVGMAVLVPAQKLTGLEGHVEDVVVHDAHRGMGIGRALMEEVIREARACGMQRIHLTSNPNNPARTAARALYAKLGFDERAGRFVLNCSE